MYLSLQPFILHSKSLAAGSVGHTVSWAHFFGSRAQFTSSLQSPGYFEQNHWAPLFTASVWTPHTTPLLLTPVMSTPALAASSAFERVDRVHEIAAASLRSPGAAPTPTVERAANSPAATNPVGSFQFFGLFHLLEPLMQIFHKIEIRQPIRSSLRPLALRWRKTWQRVIQSARSRSR